MTHQILFYDYVEGIVEKRAPHREAHLEHGNRWRDAGKLVLGGAIGDPPHGGVLVFTADADVQEFVDADPYVIAGLVEGHRVDPWNVVIQ